MDHTESFVLTGMRDRWISHTGQWLIYKQTWSKERNRTVKQNQRQAREALREAIFTILGVLWMHEWKNETSTHIVELEDQGGLKEVSRKNGDHLALLRENDADEIDFSHNPERAYDYITQGLGALFRARIYLGISIFCFVLTALFNTFSKKDGTGMSYIMDFIGIGSCVIGVLSIITCIISYREERSYWISVASLYLGNQWKPLRQKFIDVGFVEAAICELMNKESDKKTILEAKTLSDQLKAGEILRDIFGKYFAEVGVPYVESFESSAREKPEQIKKAEETFNSMASLVRYMGFTKHPGTIRAQAYEAARMRVQEAKDGPPTEVILHFPGTNRHPKDKHPTTWGGPPPPEPPEAA